VHDGVIKGPVGRSGRPAARGVIPCSCPTTSDAARDGGLTTGTLLALTHVGTAVVFVLAGVAVISRSLAAAGRTPAFEFASAVLITLIGTYLVVRLLRPHFHAHVQDGRALAVATGLVPCPLTTFILTYALARGKLAIGLAAVLGMMLGVIVTLASFAVLGGEQQRLGDHFCNSMLVAM
jgi:ABC-type nickel/cobalt efflux system permease component RcnA